MYCYLIRKVISILQKLNVPGVNPTRTTLDTEDTISHLGRESERFTVIHLSEQLYSVPVESNQVVVERLPEQFACECSNLKLWMHYGGVFISAQNEILESLAPSYWSNQYHPGYNRLFYPRKQRVPGLSLVLSTPGAATDYYHWVADALPKLGLIEASGYTLSRFDNIFINHGNSKYQLETLEELGVPLEKVTRLKPHDYIEFERAVVPSHSSSQKLPQWKISWLRKNFGVIEKPNPSLFPSKIYISRQKSRRRRFLNPDAIEEVLHQQGYTTIYLEDHSQIHQRSLFHHATHICALHGAGLINLLYSRPGLRLVEIYHPDYTPAYFSSMTEVLGINYQGVIGERLNLPFSSSGKPLSRDVYLDPDVLLEKLQTN